MEHKWPQIFKTILREKNRTGGIKLSVFRLYYKAGVIKPVQYRHKNKLIDQRNRIEIQEINSHTYGQLIDSKGEKKYTKDRRQSIQ